MNGVGLSVTLVNAKEIKKVINKIKSLLKGKKKILILGCSGVGKTQFVNSISFENKEKQSKRISRENRTTTNYKVKFFIEDSAILLTDTPGEGLNDIIRKNEITELLKNKGEGIINVVSYGYHEGPVSHLYDVFDEGNVVKKEYINMCRQKEIEQLDMWINWMGLSEIKWVITLVSKADVWWDDDWDNVKKYYETGEYATRVKKLKDNGIQHIILPYSSIIDPFYNIKGSEKFGETKKSELYKYFLEQLLNLLGIEQKTN